MPLQGDRARAAPDGLARSGAVSLQPPLDLLSGLISPCRARRSLLQRLMRALAHARCQISRILSSAWRWLVPTDSTSHLDMSAKEVRPEQA